VTRMDWDRVRRERALRRGYGSAESTATGNATGRGAGASGSYAFRGVLGAEKRVTYRNFVGTIGGDRRLREFGRRLESWVEGDPCPYCRRRNAVHLTQEYRPPFNPRPCYLCRACKFSWDGEWTPYWSVEVPARTRPDTDGVPGTTRAGEVGSDGRSPAP